MSRVPATIVARDTALAMSLANVELVRRNLDAFNGRDIEGYVETIADDFVLHSQFGAVEGRTYHGHHDIPKYFEDLAEAWNHYRAEPQDLVQGKNDKVACVLLVDAEAERSGIKLTRRLGAVFSVRAGKVVGIDTYPTRADALKAVGLPVS